ncbi:endothelin-converting enzyme 1-like [Amblyomma americanum]
MDDKSEPRENDKCMEPESAAPAGGMSKLRAQVTSAVANIPSLVIVLLCVLLLVFFVIIVALSVKVHSGAGVPDARCLTASCLRSAGRVLEGLAVDAAAPCDDAHAFACGRWGGDAAAALRRRAHHAVRHLVDLVPVEGEQKSAAAKAKRFYETCMEPRSLSQDALALLIYRLRHVGGWELIGSSSWSLQSWDRDTALEKLQVDLGVSPFFALGVADRTIRLEPAGFTFPSYEYYADGKPESSAAKVLSSYRELIERVSTYLRDGPPSLANAELADTIINYERRLLERLRPRENVSEPSAQRTTVAQLTRMVPIVKWEQLLSAYFHGHSIGQDTPVLISQPHYFSGLSQIISTTDTTTLNHYMMWRMVMKYAPHLDRTVRSHYFRFQQFIHGAEDPDQPEEHWWEQCARHTSHYLRHAVGYLYATKAAGSRVEDTVRQAEALAEQVKKQAIDSVSSVAWLTDKGPLREKLSSVELRVGYAFKDRPKELDNFYLDLIIKPGSHLENVFEAERFLGRQKARLLSDRATDLAEDQAWTISAVDTRPIYNRELNTVVVPLAALQSPIFSLEEHPALLYGSFGSLVGRLMFECLDQADADEGRHLFRNNVTRASLQETLRCLANGYPALDKTLPVNGLLVAGEALADIAGLTAAFRAFETESSGKDKLPGLEWTAEQLFFIGYAQSMCEEVLLRRLEIWSLVSSSAPKRLRVLQTLQQFPEFGRSFGCGTDPESNICHAW